MAKQTWTLLTNPMDALFKDKLNLDSFSNIYMSFSVSYDEENLSLSLSPYFLNLTAYQANYHGPKSNTEFNSLLN